MSFRIALLALAFPLFQAEHANSDDSAEARVLIGKAVEAAGGREALERYEKPFTTQLKVKSHTVRGVLENTGKKTRWFPDRFRDESPGPMGQGNYGMVFNGESGKVAGFSNAKGGTVTRTVTSFNQTQIDQARDSIYGEWLTTLRPLDGPDFGLAMVEEIVIDGRPSVGLRISHADRPDVELYFDKETHVLTKRFQPWRQPGESRGFTFLYDDYIEADGLVYPRKCTRFLGDQKTIETEITELRFLDAVDEELFEEP
jgi:hypothetical protein